MAAQPSRGVCPVSLNRGMSNISFLSAFLFDSSGSGEIFLILAIVLVLFGPRRLPEFARMIGRILSQLRNASSEFKDQIMRIDTNVRDDAAVHESSPNGNEHAKALDAEEIPGEEPEQGKPDSGIERDDELAG